MHTPNIIFNISDYNNEPEFFFSSTIDLKIYQKIYANISINWMEMTFHEVIDFMKKILMNLITINL